MSLLGVYPFKVFVANTFAPDQKVGIKVRHYHHLGYYTGTGENKKFVIDPIVIDPTKDSAAEYTIPGGYRLGFPMLMGDEYLEISLDILGPSDLPSECYIQVGYKAKCYPTDKDNKSIRPMSDSTLGENDDKHGDHYYMGGIWNLDEPGWKMIIRKYGPDPEDENVTVGEQSPG